MNKLDYLLKAKEIDIREIYDTWQSLGGLTVTNKTKLYLKDSLFKVTEEGPLKDSLVFCTYDYTVTPDSPFLGVDWQVADTDSLEGDIFFYQGVASPNFKVILSTEEYAQIDTTVETPDDFIPFNKSLVKASSIIITDEEYLLCVTELGLPFLREEELEYSRDIIIDTCIKPALDQFYAYFPIVIDEAVGPMGGNVKYEVPYHDFPENPTAFAYKAIPYMTLGTMGTSGTAYTNAFTYMRSEYMGFGGGGMATGGMFGRGVSYRKPVPGFAGMENMDASLQQMAVRQGYMNYFRQEYERDIFKNGKKYVSGFTSIGGSLNIHWLCMDKDYSHIDYWMLPEVRKLATAYALRNFGMLRSLIKPDDNSPLDFSMYTARADALEEKVLGSWKTNPNALIFAIKRGGK